MLLAAAPGGTLTQLPGIPGQSEVAWDINDAGVIVGTSDRDAVRWIEGEIEALDGPTLGVPSGCSREFADARWVTDDGTVIGRQRFRCDTSCDPRDPGDRIFRAVRWDGDEGVWIPYPIPEGATGNGVYAAADNGDLVMWINTATWNDEEEACETAFATARYDADSGTITSFPEADGCRVFATNTWGLTVGSCGSEAIAWANGDTYVLETSGDDWSFGRGLNEHGQIVGVLEKNASHGNLFHFPGRGATWHIDAPWRTTILRSGWANDVNNFGVIAGGTGFNSDQLQSRYGAVWDGNDLITIGTFGGPGSIARAINDHGAVVGQADTANSLGTEDLGPITIEFFETDAFLWEP